MTVVQLTTHQRQELIDITRQVEAAVANSGVQDGIVVVFSPHTTGGIMVNENWDPDVGTDFLAFLGQRVPHNFPDFRHGEGNSDSHILVSLVGSQVSLIIQEGHVMLGQWQGIYFCEFDGPRERACWVQVVPVSHV